MENIEIQEEQLSQEPQAPPQQDPPSKKLWQVIIDQGLYSKSFEEFQKQYNNKESLDKLHNVIIEKDLYSKSRDEFENQYFPELKKKETSAPSSNGSQVGVSDGTISTTEPELKRGEFVTGEIFIDKNGQGYQMQNGEKVYAPLGDIPKIEPPKELYMKDGVVIDMSIEKEFEDFPKGAEKLEIKRESGEIEKPYSREALLKLRNTDYGAYKDKLNAIKTYFDIRENLGTSKANEFARLQFESTGNLYNDISNFEFTKNKQKQIIEESLTGEKKQKALDRLNENEKNWVNRSLTPQKAKEYIDEKLKREYKGENAEDLTIDEIKQKLGGGVVNEAILNKYKKFVTPESLEEGVINDNEDSGSRIGYIFNGLLNGIGSYASGASDLMMQLLVKALPTEAVGGTDEEALKKWREEAETTIRTATEEIYGADVSDDKKKQYEKEFWTQAFRGIASSLPFMMGYKGSGFVIGGYDAGLQMINSTPEGKKLPESTKTIFAASVGIANAALEKLGLDKIFGKQSKRIAIGIASKTISELVEKSTVPITKEVFEAALNASVKSLKDKVIKAGGKIGKGAAIEFVTGGLQETVNVTAEKLINLSEKKQIFEPQSTGEMVSRIFESAKLEMVGGAVFGGISALTPGSKNYIAEKVAEAKSEEDIVKLKDEVLAQAQKNNIGTEQSNQLIKLIDDYTKINSKIPSDIENRKEVINKIKERDELKAEIENKKKQLEDADEAFKGDVQKELDALQGRYDEMNEEVISSSKGEKEAELPEAKPIYKIGDKEVTKEEMIDFVESGKAKESTEPLFVEGDTEVEGMVKGLGGEVVEKVAEPPKAEITDTEYSNFIDKGIVTPERLNYIAQKVKNKEKLSDREQEIFTDKTADINKIIAGEEVTLKAEEKPTLIGIEQEETIKQIKPFTDRMVEIERDFKNEGFEIDTDYDNEIVVTDKKGEIADAEELPDNLRKLAGDYEKATMKLGEFDASAREKALAESRKVTEVEAEVVEPKKAELPLAPEKVTPKVEEEITPKISKDTKTEYTTKSGKQKINKVNGELVVTDVKTGKRVSKPTERKAIKEWEESFDFSKGKMAPEFEEEYIGTSPETAYAEHVIETSENPLEIAQIFIAEEYEPAKLSTKESLIAEFGIGKTTNKSFQRFGDRNLITLSLAKAYLSNKEGASLDVIAKEMSDHYGYEITPQDLVDFMVRFPNGVKDALKMSETEVAQNAYEKFKKLTGLELTRPLAERLIQKEFDKLSSEQQKIINEDYETAKQLEDEYWKTYKETNGFTKESVSGEVKPAIEAKPKEPAAEKVEPKAELPKEEVKEYNSKNLPNPIGEFEVVNVIPYTTAEKNKFAPNQQLKFNQGDKYEPVRIVGDSELIELIQIGSRERSNLTSSVKKPINRVRQKVLEDKYGIRAYEASERARELAKQNRGDVENIIIIGEKPIEKPTAEKVEPKTELPKEEKIAEKTPLQKASEARRAAKAKLDSLRKGFGINEQAKLEALVDYHRALVTEAKEFIKEKSDDINEWAKSIGEKVNVVLQKAWDEAKGAKPVEKAEDLGYSIENIAEPIVGITKKDIKERAAIYNVEIEERREKITDAEIEIMAKDLIQNGYDIDGLVKESLAPEKRAITDIEANILAEVAAGMENKIDENSSSADIKKYRDVLGALNKGISEAARALRMAKVKKNKIESIADVMADMMEDNLVDELTPEQRKEAKKRYEDVKKALDNEVQLRKQAEAEIDRLKAELEIERQKKKSEGKPRKSNQEYTQERKAIVQSIKDKWKAAGKGAGGLMVTLPYAPQLMAIAPDVTKLIKSYIEQGSAKTLDEVRKLLKKDMEEAEINVTDEDVRNLIAGNYTEKKPTRNQLAKQLFELRQEEKLLLQLEGLEKGEKPTTERKKIERNQKLTELRTKIRELTGKDMNEEFIRTVKTQITANNNKQNKIQEKIKKGDFSPEEKKQSILENEKLKELNRKLYDDYLKSVLDKDEALLDYEKKRVEDKMKNRTKLEKLGEGIDVLLTTSKGTVAMFDQSVFLVQMLPFALSHPLKTVQFAARSIRDFSSKTKFDENMALLHGTELYKLIEKTGLALYEPRSAKSELRNELHGGDKNLWNKEITVGGKKYSVGQAFERATTSALNNARLYLFMSRVQDLYDAGKTFENSPKDFEAAARFINEFTGHGKVKEDIAKASKVLNKFIWSPKMFASTLNILGIGDIVRPIATANAIGRRLGITTKESAKYKDKGFYTSLTPEQGKFAIKELTRFIGGGVMLMVATKLASMMNGDDEDDVKLDLDPRSSSFGSMKIKGKDIMVFGRFGSAIRTIVQGVGGVRIVKGEEDILGDKYGEKTAGDVVFGSFVRGKMTPTAGLAYDFVLNNRKNYYTREELELPTIGKQMFIPMSMQDIIKDFDRDGALVGIIETLGKIYGASIRDERDFKKAETGKKRRKQGKQKKEKK